MNLQYIKLQPYFIKLLEKFDEMISENTKEPMEIKLNRIVFSNLLQNYVACNYVEEIMRKFCKN